MSRLRAKFKDGDSSVDLCDGELKYNETREMFIVIGEKITVYIPLGNLLWIQETKDEA